jgi:hypothetical protein
MDTILPNPLLPISDASMAQNPQAPVSYHTHNGIDSPLLSTNSSNTNINNGEITGTVTTTDGNPKLLSIYALPKDKAAYFMTKIEAVDVKDELFAGFVLGATFRNNAGDISLIGQVQDMYTMRDDNWDCDYTAIAGAINLQVQGKANQTIVWNYSILKV